MGPASAVCAELGLPSLERGKTFGSLQCYASRQRIQVWQRPRKRQKEEEKDEEKEKERKVVKVRKAKAKAKAKERKEKESVWEEQYAVSAIKKDIGEMSAPTDMQYETLKPKNMYQEQKLMCTIHRIRTSIQDRMLSNLEVSDRQRVDRIQES